MSIFSTLYTELLWRPLFNGLVWFYTALPIHDLGLAIVALTILIRVLMTPLLLKAQRAQRNMAVLQPEIKKVQEQHKSDREAQGKALMELYAKHKVNPFSGCLIMLIQFPVLIALFQVFHSGFEPDGLKLVYSFISNPGTINPITFGGLNLAEGSMMLGVLAAVTQFLQTKLSAPSVPVTDSTGFAKAMQVQTLYIFPVLILIWSRTFPSALMLYWTVTNVFGILQELTGRRIAKRKAESGK